MKLRRSFFALLIAGALASAAPVASGAGEAPETPVEQSESAAPVALPENFLKGLEEARKSGRDVIVVLNAADWGGWCERLRADILQKPAFIAGAAKDFVTVNLDFPQKTRPPEADHRSNLAFARKYSVTGFPVVLLFDSAGRAYARTGYTTADAAEYLGRLTGLKKTRMRRDELIARAHRNKGDIRADLLAKALRMIDGSLTPGYPELFEELRALDASDRSGAILDYDISLLHIRAGDAARAARSPGAGLWEYDAFLAAHPVMPPVKRQRVLLERFAYLDRAGMDGLSRIARHERHLDKLGEMLALAPNSENAKKIRQLIETQENELQKLRETPDAPDEDAGHP